VCLLTVVRVMGSRVMTETHVRTDLRWEPAYLKTVPGALKAAVVTGDIISFICIALAAPYYKESALGEWIIFVSMTGFWVSLVLLLMYLIHLIEKFHVIPWLMIEFGFYALWTFFFMTAGCAAAVEAKYSAPLGAASFFCFLCCLLYGYDSFLKFRGWRAGLLAQGERQTVTLDREREAY